MTKNSYTRTFSIRTEDFPFQPATILAPMEGVTDITVRNTLGKIGGIGVLSTEFVRVSCSVVSSKTVKKAVIKTPGIPLNVQVMGNDASKMADSAQRVEEAGADIVDINLGCPTKKAVKGNVGSAMLKDPDLLYEVMSAMRQKVQGWLSAKIRAGFDESSHVTHIARTVEASGADFISVHPRRRRDFYDGVADWRIIAHLKENLNIPVIGNGDIWYPQDAVRMKEITACDAVMIGRGAMRNPWIFKMIAEPEFLPGRKDVIDHFSSLKEQFLEAFEGKSYSVLNRMKEIVKYFSLSLRNGVEFRKEILRKQELDEFLGFLYEYVEKLNDGDFDFNGQLGLMKSGMI